MGWGGSYGGGGRGDYIPIASDESHFNVSLIVTDKVTRQRSAHVAERKKMAALNVVFGEKGQPKRIRAEAVLLTSLTPKLC